SILERPGRDDITYREDARRTSGKRGRPAGRLRRREALKMKILIVGSGGREHAIAWKIAQSPLAEKIYCAPGNAGIEEYAQCVDIGAMEFEKLADFAQEHSIDLTVIGMDDPLVGGIVDVFEVRGLRVLGPRKNA